MTCGKAKNLDRSFMYLRCIYAVVFAFALTLFCLFAFVASTAMGQTPASVLELNPYKIVAVPALSVTSATVEPQTMAPSDLIATAPQENAIKFSESDSFIESFDADFQSQQHTSCSAAQSIRLRKNVLGCKACYQVLPQDEIWVVSVRACSCDPENVGLFKVKKLEGNCWQESSLDALSESHLNDTSRTTMLYVHGNQTNHEYGVARGVQLYNNLFVKYECPRSPVRLVLWLWQSDREVPRLYSDYIIKSHRAVTMGKTLTRTLDALGNRRIAIVGFSLGAQVVLSSLEQMEPKNGWLLDDANQRSKYNVALIAPATDPDYICDKINHCVQSTIVRKSIVIVNADDRAVKAMRFVIRHECPEAHYDFSELARSNHLPLGEMEFLEISQEISRKHSITRYTRSPSAQRAMTAVLNRTAAEAF